MRSDRLPGRDVPSRVVTGLAWRVHDGLDAAAEPWRALEAKAAKRCFQSFAWARAWAGTCGLEGPSRLRIVIGCRNEAPVILLPLALQGRRGMSSLGWLAGDWNDYNGPIVSREFDLSLSPRELEAVWAEIGRVAGPASVLKLLKQSPTLSDGRTNPLLHPSSFPENNGAYALRLKPEMASPKALRGGRTFGSLDRKVRALQREGAVSFGQVPAGPAAQAVVAAMLDWKRTSLAARGSSNPFSSDQGRAFLGAFAGDAESGARVFALSLDGRPIAASLCLAEGSRLLLYQTAYDARYARLSPGGQLLRATIVEAVSSGFEFFDFGFGDDPYKEELSDERITLTRALAPLSALGSVQVPFHRMSLGASRWAKSNQNAYRALLAANRQIQRTKERLRRIWPTDRKADDREAGAAGATDRVSGQV